MNLNKKSLKIPRGTQNL